VPASLTSRVLSRLGHYRRRASRAAARWRRRTRKRLARSWWLRESFLATRITGLRFRSGLYFDDLERVLHALERDSDAVTLIQVGACEASVGDPLGWFLRAAGWRGVLVEPVPYLFERVRRNAGGLPGVKLENSAIAAEVGERTFYFLEPCADDPRPDLHKTIGSFLRENLERHAEYIADFEERVIEKPLPCLPLSAVCTKHDVDRLDLLFCDAEGYDYEVLKTLDWERTPPRLVVWEHQHLSESDAGAARRLLEAHGYDVHALSKDSVALRSDADAPRVRAALAAL
jgi:FkbM family methyltransferase